MSFDNIKKIVYFLWGCEIIRQKRNVKLHICLQFLGILFFFCARHCLLLYLVTINFFSRPQWIIPRNRFHSCCLLRFISRTYFFTSSAFSFFVNIFFATHAISICKGQRHKLYENWRYINEGIWRTVLRKVLIVKQWLRSLKGDNFTVYITSLGKKTIKQLKKALVLQDRYSVDSRDFSRFRTERIV